MPQIYYILLHLAMISAGTYFMADMANLSLASYLESFVEKSSPSTKHPDHLANRDREEGPHNYRVIIQRNIFNSESKPSSVSANTSAKVLSAKPAALPPLNLTLIGTVVSKGGSPYAVIKAPREKKQVLYRKGDVIGNPFGNIAGNQPKVIEISRNKVVLLRGGSKEVLEVKVDSKKKQKIARGSSRRNTPEKSKQGGTVRQVSDNKWLLDRRELDDALKNLPQLLTKARIIPSFKDGKPDGFRIFAIARDSLYAKIGLKNGDILHRINGVDVRSPQNFMKVMEQIKDESNIDIDLVRSNQKQTFSYEIR